MEMFIHNFYRCASFRTPDHVREEWAKELGLPNFVSERYTAALDAVCQRIGVRTGEGFPL